MASYTPRTCAVCSVPIERRATALSGWRHLTPPSTRRFDPHPPAPLYPIKDPT